MAQVGYIRLAHSGVPEFCHRQFAQVGNIRLAPRMRATLAALTMFGPLDMTEIVRRVAALARWRFRYLERIVSQHLAVARMFMFAGRVGLAFVLAALCLGARAAHAQAAPVPYWIPGWPLGFGGNLTAGQSSNPYDNFTSSGGSDARGGGYSYMHYNFPNGWFAVAEGGPTGLSMN